jgi:uncharacterized protein (TIGR00661 family)
MRIGIAINGEGKGHVTRMTALSRRLAGDHELFFWAPGTISSMLETAFPESAILPVPVLKFVMNREKIDLLRTGIDNLDTIVQAPTAVRHMSDQMRLLRIEGLLSDFEPYSTKAARIAGIPILQLNHPGIVLKAQTLMPDALLGKIVAGSMMGDYDECLISSFYGGDIGPILREEVRAVEAEYREHIVVYVRRSMQERVLESLGRVTNREIRVFPSEKHDFIESLGSCGAVVATSGHQLSSEALFLKKPIFSIPMEGQFEQRLNAIMIERSGRGLYARMDRIDSDLKRFFGQLDDFLTESEKPAPEGYCFWDDSLRAAFLVDRFFSTGGLPPARNA